MGTGGSCGDDWGRGCRAGLLLSLGGEVIYARFKQSFIFCFMLGVALFLMSWGMGCGGTPASTVEKTVFSAPTTVPSVTPPIAALTTDNTNLQTPLNQLPGQVSALTPQNVPTQKPVIADTVSKAITASNHLTDDLATARASAAANDAAVIAVSKERDDARALVISTEERAAAQKAASDKALASAEKDTQRLVLLFNFGVIAAGGILAILGGIMAFEGKGSLGLIMLGSGIAVVGGGYAGIYFGWQIGLCALVAGGAAVVVGVWYLIHSLKADGQTTIQAVQQAKIAGVIPTDSWPVLKQMFDSIQTPGAKAMVAAETK